MSLAHQVHNLISGSTMKLIVNQTRKFIDDVDSRCFEYTLKEHLASYNSYIIEIKGAANLTDACVVASIIANELGVTLVGINEEDYQE